MVDVLEYLEYRDFLKDWFAESKKDNPFTSYRYLSQKTGVDPAWLVRVFQKGGHLNEDSLPVFIRLCKLDDRRAEYFKTLYRFNKTKAKQALSELYYKLMELREMETRVLTEPELAYFGSWSCSALRALIGITKDTSNIPELASHLNPPISQDEARNSGLSLPTATAAGTSPTRFFLPAAKSRARPSATSIGILLNSRRNLSTGTSPKNATSRAWCLPRPRRTCPKSSTASRNSAAGSCNSPARASAPTAFTP